MLSETHEGAAHVVQSPTPSSLLPHTSCFMGPEPSRTFIPQLRLSLTL